MFTHVTQCIRVVTYYPLNTISFMTVITCTSGRLHSEFVRLLFLQDHRETYRFFPGSGVQLPKKTPPLSRLYLYVLTLTLTGHLSLQEHITLSNLSSINLVFIFRCSSPPKNPVYVRRVKPSTFVFSLSSHRQSYIGLLYSSRFIDLL
jgi:hypothetical protein